MKKKITSILLALMVLGSLPACNSASTNDGNSASESTQDGLPVVANEYIVKNAASDYEVLYPANALPLELVAVNEFVAFFKEATQIALRMVSDDKMEEDGKYISIGYTKLLSDAGYTYSTEELKTDGFKIKTLDDDVLIFGASDYGSLYGAYETLGYLFNFEYFYNDCYSLNKGVTNLSLYDFDVVEVPDIEYRATGYGSLSNNNMDCYRLRMRPYPDFFIPINGIVFHNSLSYVQSSPDYNPAYWLATSGDQLCYTAGGNEQELEKMLNASFETLKTHLIKMPDRKVVTFTIEDNPNFCACDACQEIISQYNGANSSVVIMFLNKLNAKVRAWFQEDEGKPYARDLDIVFFAYNATTDAPVVFNEQKQIYEGINGLKLDEGVSVMYAPIAADFTGSLKEGINVQYYKTAQQWSDITRNMYLWIYSTNFSYYLAPYDSFDGIADNYLAAKEVKTRWIFDQAQWNEYGFSTGWSNLKSYINAKLAWDADADIDGLINDFFKTYFGPAEAEMKEIFAQLRVLSEYNKENQALGGLRSIYQDVMQEKFWPKNLLSSWLELYDKALAKIEPLKETNPVVYRRYYKHIAGERLSVYYLFISLYSYNTDETVIKSYQTQFKTDAEFCGVTLSAESTSAIIDALFKQWGF